MARGTYVPKVEGLESIRFASGGVGGAIPEAPALLASTADYHVESVTVDYNGFKTPDSLSAAEKPIPISPPEYEIGDATQLAPKPKAQETRNPLEEWAKIAAEAGEIFTAQPEEKPEISEEGERQESELMEFEEPEVEEKTEAPEHKQEAEGEEREEGEEQEKKEELEAEKSGNKEAEEKAGEKKSAHVHPKDIHAHRPFADRVANNPGHGKSR